MKQPKKLTLKNKKLLAYVGLNPMEWMNYFEDDVWCRNLCYRFIH